jgi:hypothetical protein
VIGGGTDVVCPVDQAAQPDLHAAVGAAVLATVAEGAVVDTTGRHTAHPADAYL